MHWTRKHSLLVVLLSTVAGAAFSQEVDPGSYLSPLVRLQRLQGVSDHLHVDEVRLRDDGLLLQCSYTFGVVDARDAGDMRYLSQGLRHEIPGDDRRPGCIHLAWEKDWVFTTHRGNIRNPAFLAVWDIGDPASPAQIEVLQEPGVSYEGIDAANGHLFVGLHERGLGVYRFESGKLRRIGLSPELSNAWGVAARGDVVFVADGPGGLVTVDVSIPQRPRALGRVATGGQATGVVVNGDVAYVAAGSEGLVVVDVSDVERPSVLARVAMPGSAIRVDYSDDHVFVAAWGDARVYDVADPLTPRFVGSVRFTRDLALEDPDRPAPTSRVLAVAARGRDVFVGNWHVLHSYRLFPDRRAPSLRMPETTSNLDFGPVEPGATRAIGLEILNEGTAPLAIVDARVHGDAFTAEPRGLTIEPGEIGRLELTFRPTDEEFARGYLQILSDDPQAPLRRAYLVGNRPGLGVGMPLPDTRARLLDGGDWVSTEARGSVLLLGFFATF